MGSWALGNVRSVWGEGADTEIVQEEEERGMGKGELWALEGVRSGARGETILSPG